MYNSIKVDSEKQLLHIYEADRNDKLPELTCKSILNYEYSENTRIFDFSDMETLESKIDLISEEEFLYAVYSAVAACVYVRNESNGKAEILAHPKYCFYNAAENTYKFAFALAESDKADTFVKDFLWDLIFDAAYTTSEIEVVNELLNYLRTSRKVSAEDVMLIIELCRYGESIIEQYQKAVCIQKDDLQAIDKEPIHDNHNFTDVLLSAENDSADVNVKSKGLLEDLQEEYLEKNVTVNKDDNTVSAGECKVDFSSFLSSDIGFSGVYTKEHIPENMSRKEEYNQSRNKAVGDFSSFLFEQRDCLSISEQGISKHFADGADVEELSIHTAGDSVDACFLESEDKIYSENAAGEFIDEESVCAENEDEVDSIYIAEDMKCEEIYNIKSEDKIYSEDAADEFVNEEFAFIENKIEFDSKDITYDADYIRIICAENKGIIDNENIDELIIEVENNLDHIKENENKGDMHENIWSFSKHSETDSAELCFLSGEAFNIVKPICNIGRNSACSDVKLKDGRVSRRHAVIEYQNSGYYIYDAKSANGTYVNGTKLLDGEKKLLSEGDIIKIGIFELYFQYTNKR